MDLCLHRGSASGRGNGDPTGFGVDAIGAVLRRTSSGADDRTVHPGRHPGDGADRCGDGESAEYFNAAHLLQTWGDVLTGGSLDDLPSFIGIRDDVATPAALMAGTVMLFLQPAVIIGLFVLPISWFLRRSGG